MQFKNLTFLITGGTGSFGSEFAKRLLSKKAKEVRIFSRDETKQFEMRNKFANYKNLTFYIGDVRDPESMTSAFKNVDCVFHAAALKQVPSSEYFPIEAINTNVIGTKNVIDCCIQNKVKKMILLSTDKAVYPVNVMGQTKALAEKILISKARFLKQSITNLCITRYGNVISSRGSVVPFFINQIKNKKPLTITDFRMTRFFMTMDDAIDLIEYAFKSGKNGHVYIKKCDAVKIIDVAEALKKIYKSKLPLKNIGVRVGEKIHESLMSKSEMNRAKNKSDYFELPPNSSINEYDKFFYKGKKISNSIQDYSSNLVKNISIKKIIKILKKYSIS